MEPRFLTQEQVLYINRDQTKRYGGIYGVRDAGILDSALAMPRSMFGGSYLHEDIYSMAAAYLYHLVLNHPFLDGNKRVGLASAVIFLTLNGVEAVADNDPFADLIISVAEGKTEKLEVAEFLRRNSSEAGMELNR